MKVIMDGFMIKIYPMLAIGFNESRARSDVKAFLDPFSNWIMFIATAVATLSILISYVSWSGKDDDEKQQQPFKKIAKNHLIGYIIAMAFGIVLKWLSF